MELFLVYQLLEYTLIQLQPSIWNQLWATEAVFTPSDLFCQADIKRVSFAVSYSKLASLIDKTVRVWQLLSPLFLFLLLLLLFFFYSVHYIIKQMSIKLEFSMACLIQWVLEDGSINTMWPT